MRPEQIEVLIDKFPSYIDKNEDIYFFVIFKSKYGNRHVGYVTRNNKWLFDCYGKCLIDALNNAIIWLAENGYVDFNEKL